MLRSATTFCLLLGATIIASPSTTNQPAGSAPTAPSEASIAEF